MSGASQVQSDAEWHPLSDSKFICQTITPILHTYINHSSSRKQYTQTIWQTKGSIVVSQSPAPLVHINDQTSRTAGILGCSSIYFWDYRHWLTTMFELRLSNGNLPLTFRTAWLDVLAALPNDWPSFIKSCLTSINFAVINHQQFVVAIATNHHHSLLFTIINHVNKDVHYHRQR